MGTSRIPALRVTISFSSSGVYSSSRSVTPKRSRSGADSALLALEVDYLGLDQVDRRMLRAIIENYGGGPVGLDTLAATIGEESVTLEDVYEPYLMQLGFLTRTPRGRCVTRKAYEHLHMEFMGQTQLEL